MTIRSQAIKVFAASSTVLAASVLSASPAPAGPPDDPCPLSLLLLCRMIPTAPDLDGDVDLTTQLPTGDTAQVTPPVPAPLPQEPGHGQPTP